MRRFHGDETSERLKNWTSQSKSSERFAADLLKSEGFNQIEPSHPKGGPDGKKDIKCSKDGLTWIVGVYFPHGDVSFSTTKKKVQRDLMGVMANNADGFIFFTNQEFSLSQRDELMALSSFNILIYFRESIRVLLHHSANLHLKLEYLLIEMDPSEIVASFSLQVSEMLNLKKSIESLENAVKESIDNKKNNDSSNKTSLSIMNEDETTSINDDLPNNQIVGIFNHVSTKMNTRNFSVSLEDIEEEFEAIRIFLFSSSWLNINSSSSIMENHELHILYRYKEKLQLINAEKTFLLNTLIHQESDHITGWYWFQNVNRDQFFGKMLFDAFENQKNRKNLLNLISNSKYFFASEHYFMFNELYSDKSNRKEFLNYLSFNSGVEIIELLDNEINKDYDIDAEETKYFIMSKYEPSNLLKLLILVPTKKISNNMVDNLKEIIIQEFNEVDILLFLNSPNKYFRSIIIIHLIENKQNEDINKYIASNNDLTMEAIQYLIDAGYKLPPAYIRESLDDNISDQIIFELLLQSNIDKDFDFFDAEGHVIYKIIIQDYDSARIFNDLDQNFENLKDSFLKKVFDSTYTAIVNVLKKDKKMTDEDILKFAKKYAFQQMEEFKIEESTLNFVKSRYIRIALDVLLSRKENKLISYARKYILHGDRSIKSLSVSIIEMFGDSQDIDSLIFLGNNCWGDLRYLTIKAALKCGDSIKEEVFHNIISSSKSDLINCFISYCSAESIDLKKVIFTLLSHEDESVRTTSLAYLTLKMNEIELIDFLKYYYNRNSYYYNVVCWLDRILYAPDTLRDFYKTILKNKLEIKKESYINWSKLIPKQQKK